MGQLIYLKDVVTLRLDQKKCIGCGMCLNVCPQAVLSLTNGTIEIANRNGCMECGACARNCPVEALRACRDGLCNSSDECYVGPKKIFLLRFDRFGRQTRSSLRNLFGCWTSKLLLAPGRRTI